MSTYDKLEESYEELFTLAIDWSRLKAILQSLDRKVLSKASKESLNVMMTQVMERAAEMSQLKTDLTASNVEMNEKMEFSAAEVKKMASRVHSLEREVFDLRDTKGRLKTAEQALFGMYVGEDAEATGFKKGPSAPARSAAERTASVIATLVNPDDPESVEVGVKAMRGVEIIVDSTLGPKQFPPEAFDLSSNTRIDRRF